MKGILANFSREFRAYFFSPMAYIVSALLLVINGVVFWLIVSFLNDPRAGVGAPLQLFFGQTFFFWLVMIFVAAVLTMRLLSEERRSGTIEVLMTSPITEEQVVTGKYLAALAFFAFLWLPTLAYPALLSYYSEVDWGPVATGYLGILGIGSLFLATGVLASAMTRSQLVAAVITFAILVFMIVLGFLENLVSDDSWRELIGNLNLMRHMDDFGKGVIDTRWLVYYLSATVLLLFLSARVLENKKWR